MMDKINPSFRKPLWYIRGGLLFLFPPIWTFLVLPIGYFIMGAFGFTENLVLAGLIGYSIVVYAVGMIAEKSYNGITYEIGAKGITRNFDFLWKSKKEILFVNIKEVELKIGIFQKFFGVGTVVLHTQAQSSKEEMGMSLVDLEKSNQIYELLREIVSRSNIPSNMLRNGEQA